MTYELSQIEDAVMVTLEPLKASYGIRAIETYSGNIEFAKSLADIAARLPVIWVAGESMEITPVNRDDQVVAELTIMVADRNARGPVDAQAGNFGVFAILQAIRGLLNRKRILSGWSALAWKKDASIIVAPRNSLCIYASTYITKTVLTGG